MNERNRSIQGSGSFATMPPNAFDYRPSVTTATLSTPLQAKYRRMASSLAQRLSALCTGGN